MRLNKPAYLVGSIVRKGFSWHDVDFVVPDEETAAALLAQLPDTWLVDVDIQPEPSGHPPFIVFGTYPPTLRPFL